MQDDPTESVTHYARDTLRANGVTRPGGLIVGWLAAAVSRVPA
jgi:hypothetical protein